MYCNNDSNRDILIIILNPRTMIKNVLLDEDTNSNIFIYENIAKQNNIDCQTTDLKIVTKLKTKNSKKSDVVIEVSPIVRDLFLS